jgi:hypothetical protein
MITVPLVDLVVDPVGVLDPHLPAGSPEPEFSKYMQKIY